MKIKLAFILAALMSTTVVAAEITGPSRVIDADTVVVSGVHIRLKGVDAAELSTDLGQAAKIVMEVIVNGGPLTCRLTGEATWRRQVGFCFTADGVDINQEIISQGAALSCPRYDARYLPFEQPEAVTAQERAHYCTRH